VIGPILQFEDLQELCRPGEHPRLATVVAGARRIDRRYKYDGKGGIISTVEAVNAAMGLKAANDSDKYDPSEVL
jgi:hypothetical protein